MKHIKRLFSTLLVLALALTLAVPAFAASIKVDGATTGNTYTAYKLLDVHQYGTGDKASYAYTFPDDNIKKLVLDAVKAATGNEVLTADDPNAILKAIEDMKNQPEQVRDFADYIFTYGISTEPTPEGSPIYTKLTEAGHVEGVADGDTVINNLAQGYYLVAETLKTPEGDNNVVSLVMLDTAGVEQAVVNQKEDVPSVEKKVKETNDITGDVTNWQDAADYDIGDTISFKLTATLGTHYSDYDWYKLVFHDEDGVGLQYAAITEVYVLRGEEKIATISAADGDAGYQVASSGDTFTVTIPDLKKAADAAVAGDKVVVEYTATLTEDAVIGKAGNPNTVYLEYSNNPYVKDDTGTTPTDKVTVFTFELDVNKVDGNQDPLAGAWFTLYKKTATGTALEGHEGNYTAIGPIEAKEVKGEDGNVISYTAGFEGLDSGDYVLVETTVPTGYNKMEDVEFTISATYDTENADPQLTELKVTPENGALKPDTAKSGYITGDIVNQAGALLPSTGGMGTTLFYIVGGILVAAAVILLVTKKRVNSDK